MKGLALNVKGVRYEDPTGKDVTSFTHTGKTLVFKLKTDALAWASLKGSYVYEVISPAGKTQYAVPG